MSGDAYAKNFRAILIASALIYAPLCVLQIVFAGKFEDVLTAFESNINNASLWSIFSSMSFELAVIVVFAPMSAAVAAITAKRYIDAGNPTGGFKTRETLAAFYEATLPRFYKYIITALVYFALVLIGMTLIIPGVILFVDLYFYAVIIALTGTWGLKALFGSYRAVRGRWFAALGVILATAFVNLIVQMFISVVLGVLSLDNVIAFNILQFIPQTISIYFNIVVAMWYIYATSGGQSAEDQVA